VKPATSSAQAAGGGRPATTRRQSADVERLLLRLAAAGRTFELRPAGDVEGAAVLTFGQTAYDVASLASITP